MARDGDWRDVYFIYPSHFLIFLHLGRILGCFHYLVLRKKASFCLDLGDSLFWQSRSSIHTYHHTTSPFQAGKHITLFYSRLSTTPVEYLSTRSFL
jgi:hypothetical protein